MASGSTFAVCCTQKWVSNCVGVTNGLTRTWQGGGGFKSKQQRSEREMNDLEYSND